MEKHETIPEKIGEGTYGCVHKPNLKCKYQNKTLKNKVSKIMEIAEAHAELDEYDIIEKIDKKANYFLGKPTMCIPANNETNRRAVRKCDLYEKCKKKCLKNYSLLIMKDGGKDLSEFSKKTIQELRNNEKSEIFIKKWFIELKKLFRGIILFEENGYSHHDLKPQNIVYNTKTNSVKFIDFGFMRKHRSILYQCENNQFEIADQPFWSYPFEFPYMNKNDYMKIATMSQPQKIKYYDHWIQEIMSQDESSKLYISMMIFFSYIAKYKNETEKKMWITKYLDHFKDMLLYEMIPENYDTFINKSVKTLDVFGLGMSLLFILNYCKNFIHPTIVDLLETCFFQMTNPSVLNRFTIQEAYSNYESILKNNWINANAKSLKKYRNLRTSPSFHKKTNKNRSELSLPQNEKTIHQLIEQSEENLSKYKTNSKKENT